MSLRESNDSSRLTRIRQPASDTDPQAFVSQLIRSRSSNGHFSARQILDEHPELAQFRSCVVDLAYEEYCRLRESGEPIAATEFARRYREVEQSLHRVIEFDQILHKHPSLIETIPEENWPVCGQVFCGCLLREQIGRGVLSRVFVAQQERLGDRRVVAKICARGEQEARLLGRLTHSAIAAVHSIDTDPATDLSLICMPYLTRVTLHHLVEILYRSNADGPIRVTDIHDIVDRLNSEDPALAAASTTAVHENPPGSFTSLFLHWARDLAQALDVAHRNDVLHCDVKPGNVLLLPDLSVQLLDFNLASSATVGDRMIGGTMPYMATEQLRQILWDSTADFTDEERSQSRVTASTDLFGLSATLWHLLTGAPPFGVTIDAGDRNVAASMLLARHQDGLSPEAVSQARARMPRDVIDLLQRGLDPDPCRRPRSAADMADLLQKMLQVETARIAGETNGAVTAAGTVSVLSAVPGTGARDTQGSISRLRRLAGIPLVGAGLLAAGFVAIDRNPRAFNETVDGLQTPESGLESSSAAPVAAAESETVQRSLFLIRRQQFQAARELLAPLAGDGRFERVMYLDLYCETVLLAPPYRRAAARSDAVTSGRQGTAVDASPERLTEWNRVFSRWQAFSSSGSFRVEAAINAAAMQFEVGELDAAEQLLDEIPALPGQFSAADRMQAAIRLRKFLTARGRGRSNAVALPVDDLLTLRSRAYAALSRYEAWALISTLAQILDSAQNLTDAELQEHRTELKDLIESTCGTIIEPIALRPLLFGKSVGRDAYLNSSIASRMANSEFSIQNQLPQLLVLPDFLPQPR